MKKNIILAFIFLIFSSTALAVKECDRFHKVDRPKCMNLYQRAMMSEVINKVYDIITNPSFYGKAEVEGLRKQAPKEFERIKRLCGNDTDCLYDEYKAWDTELSLFVTTAKMEACACTKAYQESYSRCEVKKEDW